MIRTGENFKSELREREMKSRLKTRNREEYEVRAVENVKLELRKLEEGDLLATHSPYPNSIPMVPLDVRSKL